MQWIAIILVTAAIVMNYMDRSTLAIGNLKIREEFGINATAIGALGSAWALTYGIAQLPSGYLLDRIGPKFLVGAAMILWSLCQAAGGIASTYFLLMLSRIGLGATEAPCFPSATRSVNGWFDVKDRGTPSGVYTSGAYIGPTLAPPILTGLMLAFDWRVMFIVMGLAGIVGAILWFLIYRDPRAQVLQPRDEEYLRPSRQAKSAVSLRQWGSLFRFRAMWVLMLGAFCTGYITWMYQTWLPAYLEMQQHISIAKTGFLASVPLICAFFGVLCGGYLDVLHAVRHHLQMDPGDGSDAASLLRLRRQQPEFRRFPRRHAVTDSDRLYRRCDRLSRAGIGDRCGHYTGGGGAVPVHDDNGDRRARTGEIRSRAGLIAPVRCCRSGYSTRLASTAACGEPTGPAQSLC
jgi:sugar phosphate permease